tara:strand:+ start:4809 stop:5210 length:402 start_codon:yes stop_codon:yes gene_type:complete
MVEQKLLKLTTRRKISRSADHHHGHSLQVRRCAPAGKDIAPSRLPGALSLMSESSPPFTFMVQYSAAIQRIVQFDAEMQYFSDLLGETDDELNRPEIASLAKGDRRVRPTQSVGSVGLLWQTQLSTSRRDSRV